MQVQMMPVHSKLQGVLLFWLMVCVYGDYSILIRIHSYSNPTNTGQDHGPSNCCDGIRPSSGICGDPFWQPCDNRFTFCLKNFGDETSGTSSCVSDIQMSSELNYDDTPINFNASRWLGLDNPLRLNGISTAWEGAQIYIEVHDHDFISMIRIYQLVDSWRLNRNSNSLALVAGDAFPAPILYSGRFGFGFIELSFKLECNPGYTGADCSVDIDECLLMGPMPCSGRGDCSHGIDYFNCSCDPGYTGERCEVDIDDCVGQSCSGNGDCRDGINSYTCSCNPGYTGVDCSVDIIDECFLMEPIVCSGRGNCSRGIDYFNCSCDPGYTGERCEVDIDDCVAVNCSGNGVCVDGVNSFDCQCGSGFTGELCSVEEDQGEEIGIDVAIIAGGVAGGVVMILIVIVLTVIIVTIVSTKCKVGAAYKAKNLQQNVSYGVSSKAKGVEAQLTYDYVDISNAVTGQKCVYKQQTEQHKTERFEMKTNDVYGVHL